MWGLGGRYYWGRREKGRVEGIVVLFAWLSSQDKHLKNYVDFYSSLGWNSLVCHSQFLNLFFPEKAAILALGIINQLVQELKLRPRPVVFSSFSGGPKACMYKVHQIIQGKCEGQAFLDDYRLVRDCVSGYVFDSTPVDFVSDLGTRFVLHPSTLGMSRPPRLASWIAEGISSCLDRLFLSHFELQRAEYWQTLYSTITMKAPYLIFCSEDDDLAPFQVIYNFASRLRQLGGDVTLVKWKCSPHAGHFRRYPEEYKAAATELLTKAATVYSKRIQQQKVEKIGMGASSSPHSCNLRRAAANPSSSFNGPAVDSTDDSLIECYDSHGAGYIQGEQHYISFSVPPEKMITTGVLGQLLFGHSFPRNVEDWETGPGAITAGRRLPHFNPIKCIRRSRL